MTVTEIRPRSAEQVTREAALQLGFAWHCVKTSTEGECDEAGNDRAEYAAHMKGHGRKQIHGVRMIRLKRTAPAATLGKLDVPPLKFITWEHTHAVRRSCGCGHGRDAHGPQYITEDSPAYRLRTSRHRQVRGYWSEPGCTECTCTSSLYGIGQDVTTLTRRGQFWAAGPQRHTYWVIPLKAAGWEDGRAAPVMVSADREGKFYGSSLAGEDAPATA